MTMDVSRIRILSSRFPFLLFPFAYLCYLPCSRLFSSLNDRIISFFLLNEPLSSSLLIPLLPVSLFQPTSSSPPFSLLPPLYFLHRVVLCDWDLVKLFLGIAQFCWLFIAVGWIWSIIWGMLSYSPLPPRLPPASPAPPLRPSPPFPFHADLVALS